MKPYFLGADGKPCIWPIPNDCLWTDERYEVGESLTLSYDDEFKEETEMFILQLRDEYDIKTGVKHSISIGKCNNSEVGEEGYILNVKEEVIRLLASTREGIFYGLQTLLQLIRNSPYSSIQGVKIIDGPLKSFRDINARLTDTNNIKQLKKFIDLIAEYKINKLILGDNDFNIVNKNKELTEYISKRKIEILLCDKEIDKTVIDKKTIIINEEINISSILRQSCLLWWAGFQTDNTAIGNLLPDYLEKTIAQLYPFERDIIIDIDYPSRCGKLFKKIDLRQFYNAPLVRSHWRVDDYYMMHLKDAVNLPNTVPFKVFQGVKDYKLENSLVVAGSNSFGNVTNIDVSANARSIVFLHSFVFGKQCYIDGLDQYEGMTVGYYIVHYADGSKEKIEIVYNKTISFWKNYYGTNIEPYYANPVYMGISKDGLHYTIFSYEWINPKCGTDVEKIDIIPAEGVDAEIMVLGITVVL